MSGTLFDIELSLCYLSEIYYYICIIYYMIKQSAIRKNIYNKTSELIRADLEEPTVSLITKGRKVIYDGSKTVVADTMDLLYTPVGRHYAQLWPGEDGPFEEISITFDRGRAAQNLALLGSGLGVQVEAHRPCPACRDSRYTVYPSWNAVRLFFKSLTPYMRGADPMIEAIKKMELLAIMTANPECCIQGRIFGDNDPHTGNFEAVIYANLLRTVTVRELARLTNRSLTSFKNEFDRRFHEPPHVWMTRQRLAHARMLLTTTSLPIIEIGARCVLPNPSHFISLFSKEYGITPAAFRKQYLKE